MSGVLYTPANYEPLTDEPWDEARIRDRVAALVAETDSSFDPDAFWPPVEDWDAAGGTAPLPLTTLYRGASGVVWALDVLRRRGLAESSLDLAAIARRAYEVWDASPAPERLESPVRTHASLMDGDTGILLAAWLLEPADDLADLLYARVRENADSETNEWEAGAPGTMLAARALLERTGDERWAAAWRESAEILWERREPDGFWVYPPYGKAPGAGHGIAVNATILLAGGELLPAERREPLLRDTAAALAATAFREDGLANWPMEASDPKLEWDGQIRMQWCHGGAGVVASAAPFLEEELLLAGAELVWRAGPASMEKGPGICHGTAGNGYALLCTFGRTGDERWLERARRFAVHALGQVERWRERRGTGRHSLWAGDPGAALFAADCLDARAEHPLLDYLW
jgi:hypothetical protein